MIKPGAYWDVMWNPIKMRCTPISAGCENCWHLRFCNRHVANPKMPIAWKAAWGGRSKPFLDEGTLHDVRSWKKSRIVFVQTMGDLFHGSVPFDYVRRIWCEMLDAPQHLFMVLTKRPKRLFEFAYYEHGLFTASQKRNIIVGTSAENQQVFDERWDALQGVPADLWLSLEPLLGPIRIRGGKNLQFVAYGPETGPRARPSDGKWFEDIEKYCQRKDIRRFDKRDNPLATQTPFTPIPF